MSVKIVVTGVSKTKAFLNASLAKIFVNSNRSINDAGVKLKEEIQSSIRGQRSEPKSVDTGVFLRSISARGSNGMQSQVTSPVEHAKFLEWGTTRIPARHHFLNSANRMRSTIIDLIRRNIV